MQRPRIIIADAHRIMLEGLNLLLAARYEVVDCVTRGDDLVAAVRSHAPDAIVCDTALPGDGLDAARRIRELAPGTAIVMLTMNESPSLAAGALRLGVRGYVLKTDGFDQLALALRAALAERRHISPALANETLSLVYGGGTEDRCGTLASLTERQVEVLRLLGRGHTMKRVAQTLHISPRTVAFHKYRIMEAMGVDSSAQLIRKAVDCGFVDG